MTTSPEWTGLLNWSLAQSLPETPTSSFTNTTTTTTTINTNNNNINNDINEKKNFLNNVMKEMVENEINTIQSLVDVVKDWLLTPSSDPDVAINMKNHLDELCDLCEDINIIPLLISLNLLNYLPPFLIRTDLSSKLYWPYVSSTTATLIGNICQNLHDIQNNIVYNGDGILFQLICRELYLNNINGNENDDLLFNKCLYALSSMIRGNQQHEQYVFNNTINNIITNTNNIINNLKNERKHLNNIDNENDDDNNKEEEDKDNIDNNIISENPMIVDILTNALTLTFSSIKTKRKAIFLLYALISSDYTNEDRINKALPLYQIIPSLILNIDDIDLIEKCLRIIIYLFQNNYISILNQIDDLKLSLYYMIESKKFDTSQNHILLQIMSNLN